MTNRTNTNPNNPPAWTNFKVEGHNNSQLNGIYTVFDSDFSGTGGDDYPSRYVDPDDIPAPLYKHSEREIYVTFNNKWTRANNLEFWSIDPQTVTAGTRLTQYALDNASLENDSELNYFYDENDEITTAPIPFTYTITEGFVKFGDVEPEPCSCENNANNISTLQAFTEVLSSNVETENKSLRSYVRQLNDALLPSIPGLSIWQIAEVVNTYAEGDIRKHEVKLKFFNGDPITSYSESTIGMSATYIAANGGFVRGFEVTDIIDDRIIISGPDQDVQGFEPGVDTWIKIQPQSAR